MRRKRNHSFWYHYANSPKRLVGLVTFGILLRHLPLTNKKKIIRVTLRSVYSHLLEIKSNARNCFYSYTHKTTGCFAESKCLSNFFFFFGAHPCGCESTVLLSTKRFHWALCTNFLMTAQCDSVAWSWLHASQLSPFGNWISHWYFLVASSWRLRTERKKKIHCLKQKRKKVARVRKLPLLRKEYEIIPNKWTKAVWQLRAITGDKFTYYIQRIYRRNRTTLISQKILSSFNWSN